jgi:hypothetical protein
VKKELYLCPGDAMQNGSGDMEEALTCLHDPDVSRISAVRRLPEAGPVWAKKVFELRPEGLMLHVGIFDLLVQLTFSG